MAIDRSCIAENARELARMRWPNSETSLLNGFRSGHRAEHLDELEARLSEVDG